MALPVIFSKAKTLAPVAVVAGAVAVTIKLLTQESTPTSQLLQVKAEEDILKPEFEEELEEPQLEPEEEAEEQVPEEAVEQAESDEESAEEEEDGPAAGGDEEEEKKEEPKSNEEEQPKSAPRAFREGSDPAISILKELFADDKG